MLSIHSTATTTVAAGAQGYNLGNIGSNAGSTSEFTAGYINDIKEISVSQFIDIISCA